MHLDLGEKSVVKFDADKGRHYIARALLYGSLISTLVMALGLGLLLAHAAVVFFSPIAAAGGLWGKYVRSVALALMHSGLLLLLLTPVFRIVVACVSFFLEHDRKYVLISLGVLSVVLLSIGFSFTT
jgi:uncharacterized membrane protein